MYTSKNVKLPATTPVLIFGTSTYTGTRQGGSATDPVPVVIKNLGAHIIYVGSKTKATCVYPITAKTTMSFGIFGEDAIYGYSSTGTITVAVLVGRQS